MDATIPEDPEIAQRRHWMELLARAEPAALRAAVPALPPHRRLRGPETGLIMARGRAGGDGAPFNLGEVTVTRCSVQAAGGRVGHAYVLGRDTAHAELAAALDAALQDPDLRPALLARVVAPLAVAETTRQDRDAARAAATRVEFFTMATMR